MISYVNPVPTNIGAVFLWACGQGIDNVCKVRLECIYQQKQRSGLWLEPSGMWLNIGFSAGSRGSFLLESVY